MRHSLLGPSSLERRSLCPGSYRMESRAVKVEPETPYAEVGNLCHELVAAVLRDEIDDDVAVLKAGDSAEAVALTIDRCKSLIAEYGSLVKEVLVEKELDLSSVHPEIGFGTVDLALIIPFQLAVIVDHKFGQMEVPPARTNFQTVTYALGISDAYDCPEVRVVIIAAGRGVVSEYTFTAERLEAARACVRQVVEAALFPFAPCVPSESACHYCSAMACPAMLAAVAKAPLHDDPASLGPVSLPPLLDIADPVKKWLGGIQQRAYEIAVAGGEIPGYGLVQGRNSYTWADGVDEAKLREVGEKLKMPVDGLTVTESRLATRSEVFAKWGKSKKVSTAIEAVTKTTPGRPQLKKVEAPAEAPSAPAPAAVAPSAPSGSDW